MADSDIDGVPRIGRRRSKSVGASGGSAQASGESGTGGERESAADATDVGAPLLDEQGTDSSTVPLDLAELLGRPGTPAEQASWSVMSPSLRRRAAIRIDLLTRWTTDRYGLTLDVAADTAKVTPKRFYQMAAAWKKQPGLAAVGAYAAAPVERKARLDPRVNAALQAVVARVVKAAPKRASVESIRRSVEAAAQLRLSGLPLEEGETLGMPSVNVVRAIVTREQHRQLQQSQALGNSVAGDCCATTMLTTAGVPYVLFGIIDRATRRMLGWSLGSLDEGLAAYGRAARVALSVMESGALSGMVWADECRQLNLVETADGAAWLAFRAGLVGPARSAFQPVTNPRRYGGGYKEIVGDRIGRVVFRRTWTEQPPEAADGERFDAAAAALRVDSEIGSYNASLPTHGGAKGDARPPAVLIELLRLLSIVGDE